MLKPVIETSIEQLKEIASQVAAEVLAPDAARIDENAEWPAEGLRALGHAGLWGLHVPRDLGGKGEGLLALAVVSEELGAACSSTAMCFAMHCVASKVLAAKATPLQAERYLEPIARGRHLTTLALSEAETGAHFYLPRTRIRPENGGFRLDGSKSFVTSGGHADSYVVSARPLDRQLDPGGFSCIVVDADAPGLCWQAPPWRGFGMRGNSSSAVSLEYVPVPARNLLGAEGDELWYVFEVVAPYFLVAMSGVYLGIARAALDATLTQLKTRSHHHTGARLAENGALSDQAAEMWIRVERARQLVHHAAQLGDAGSPLAMRALFAAKIDVADAVVAVTTGAMMLAGGRGYGEGHALGRWIRDAQAAHVMSPTTHLLKSWLGHTILDLPMDGQSCWLFAKRVRPER